MALLPYYFYNINAVLPNGMTRWVDEFADAAPSVVQPKDLNPYYLKAKNARNEAYSKWLAAFFTKLEDGTYAPLISPKLMKFQVIRVHNFKHSESNHKDWWSDYQDAAFRVFMQPETNYDQVTGEHKQWYLLSPEDGYLVNVREAEKAGRVCPPREYNGRERFLSAEKMLRRARLIPVECCKHLRHETSGGELPEGL